MDSIIWDIDFVSGYLDDIVIASLNEDKHLQQIEPLLQRLDDYQLFARKSRFIFSTRKRNFGNLVSAESKAVDPAKAAALQHMQPTNTIHALQQWLGAVKYYSCFIL